MFIVISLLTAGCSSLLEEEAEAEEYIKGVDQEMLEDALNKVQYNSPINDFVCEPFDIYDDIEDICYPPETCETVEDCVLLGDRLSDEIYERFGDLLTDYEFAGDGDTYDEQVLARYQVAKGVLVNPQFINVDAQFESYRDDVEAHVDIWDMFKYIIPEKEREMLSGFTIFTDGNEELLAQVEPYDEDVHSWILGVDVMDADESFILKTTLLHEYAHLLTLRKDQMDMNEDVLFAYEDDPIHGTALAACDYYFVEWMGCTKENSYLHQFYLEFWTDIIDDWNDRDIVNDEEEADFFYEDYEDQFVTGYAVTSPDEDIAEVWPYFILFPHPEGEELWEQKILFFYQYPEQVKLRAEVLSRLLSYLSRAEG